MFVVMRYGKKLLDLGKGKTAVEMQPEQPFTTLGRLRDAASAGELDAQAEAVSAGVRRGFKR